MIFNFPNREHTFVLHGRSRGYTGYPSTNITLTFSSYSVKIKYDTSTRVIDSTKINELSVQSFGKETLFRMNGWDFIVEKDEALKLIDLIA